MYDEIPEHEYNELLSGGTHQAATEMLGCYQAFLKFNDHRGPSGEEPDFNRDTHDEAQQLIRVSGQVRLSAQRVEEEVTGKRRTMMA